MKKILITGSTGKMGLEAVKAILNDDKLSLIGAIGNNTNIGEDIGFLSVGKKIGINVQKDYQSFIDNNEIDLILDLTHSTPAYNILTYALKKGIKCISGATGFSDEQLENLKSLAESKNITTLIIPNFAIGAVLMMKFSEMAAKHLDNVEIIETHHDQKRDSPSGTAIKTAEMILKNKKEFNQNEITEIAKIPNCRGGKLENINIHSLRLPGFIATQEVIFGGLGQSLSIKHNTISRESFMPGVLLCINKIDDHKGFIYGLESLLT